MKTLSPLLLVVMAGCASTTPVSLPSISMEVPFHSEARAPATAADTGRVTETLSSSAPADVAWTLQPVSVAAPVSEAYPSMPTLEDGQIGSSYTKFKLGVFEPKGDISKLDAGVYGEVVFGRELLPFLSIEGALGYLRADSNNGDLWAVPLFVQARASVPILAIEPYAGVGYGGMYVDAGGSGAGSGDDFVTAANAFLGIDVGLGNLSLGIEGKYIVSDEVNGAFDIEGHSVMVSATLPF